MLLGTQHSYPKRKRRNHIIQIPRLLHSFASPGFFYLAQTFYLNLTQDLLKPEGVSVAMYKRRAIASDWPGGRGSTDKLSLYEEDTSTHTIKHARLEPHLNFLKRCSSSMNILVNFLYLLFEFIILSFLLVIISLATNEINLLFLIRFSL